MVSIARAQAQTQAGSSDLKLRILIADDEPQVRAVLGELLGRDHECREVASAEEALELLCAEEFALVLSDIVMGRLSGLDMLPHVAAFAPDTVVVMISAEQRIESAIQAMRAGAFDYITKPFNLEHVETAVRRALDYYALRRAKRHHETYLEKLLRQRTAQLNHASYYDTLTGLPNRLLFEDYLAQVLARGVRSGGAAALIFIDLDNFRKINESLGYQTGDRILCEFAERLCTSVDASVTVARCGGDEFALLVPRIAGTRAAAALAGLVRHSLEASFNLNGHELYLTASIGLSVAPSDGEDAETLLRNAGAALRRAREQGPGRYEFYRADMNADALKRLTLESDLRRALEREEFVVYYQPQYCLAALGDARAMQISGAEAVVRWQHPELGLVSPAEFIPLAESTDLIVPLGEWILRTACTQNRAWQQSGLSPLRMAVNLSARQFHQPHLAEGVLRVLSDTGLDPQWLELELTESLLVKDAARAVRTLSELRALGIKIAVDDFGTGYSSLSYLIELPVDALKIDRSFVRDATTDSKRAKLLKGIITLAHDLNLTVKAEGIETVEQRDMLCRLGCDELQGYLFSRPIPAGELAALLGRDSAPSPINTPVDEIKSADFSGRECPARYAPPARGRLN